MVALIKMRIHRTGKEIIIAACDANLVGKVFREGELRLEVSSFYDGPEVDQGELKRHLKRATIANFVGQKVVSIAIEEGYVDKNCVIRIDGVPHAQTVMI